MVSSFFARAALFVSLAVSMAEGTTARFPGLQKRDLLDLASHTLLATSRDHVLITLDFSSNGATPVLLDLNSSDILVQGRFDGLDSAAATSTTASLNLDFTNISITGDHAIKLGLPVGLQGVNFTTNILSDAAINPGLQSSAPGEVAVGVFGISTSAPSIVEKALSSTTPSSVQQLLAGAVTAGKHPVISFLYAGLDDGAFPPDSAGFVGLFAVGDTIDVQTLFSIPAGTPTPGFPDLSKLLSQPGVTPNNGAIPVTGFTVGGNKLPLASTVSGAQQNTVVGRLSTTQFETTVSLDFGKAIYKGTPGLTFNATSGIWNMPCNDEIIISVQIDSKTDVPLDPLSIVVPDPTKPGQCQGSIVARTSTSNPQTEDIIFGLSFLENVAFTTGYADAKLTQAQYQFLPVVNTTAAHEFFTASRTSATISWPPSATSWGSSPSSTSAPGSTTNNVLGSLDNDDASNNSLNLPSGSIADQLRHCLPAIILGAIVVAVIAIGALIFTLVRRRRGGSRHESAYRNIHVSESSDASKGLYAHDEGHSAYSDPYQDKA
ncbi:hypothetical protein BDW22DRAFT_1431432 [Trametopsis cervina]|nr:hypothetical protein BDW22DRAFT_1431432 [Trametopsis cervina]